MARIPESELDRLRAEVSVEQLARARGVKLVKKGTDLHGRCPFHDDRTPSLVITPESNLWNCFGACHEGGTVIDWVMKAEGVSFRLAVELLRADLPKLTTGEAPVVRRSTVEKLPRLAEPDAEDQVLLQRVAAYYHQTLLDSPRALEYLQGRGLEAAEMVGQFRLGFADRTLGYRLPAGNRQAGAQLRGRLQRLGVYRRNGREHLRGSVVVPLFDASGQVVQLYGRKVGPTSRGAAEHLYLPGPLRGVFNRAAFAASKELILCEAILDALTFWCAGHRNVTTTYGTSGLTDDLRAALREHGTEKVAIAYDRDAAGDKAAAKVAAELLAMGIVAYRVELPQGMDVNEFATKGKQGAQGLGAVLRAAVRMGEEGLAREATPPPEDAEPARQAPRKQKTASKGRGARATAKTPADASPQAAPAPAPEEERPPDPPSLEALPSPAAPAPRAPAPEPLPVVPPPVEDAPRAREAPVPPPLPEIPEAPSPAPTATPPPPSAPPTFATPAAPPALERKGEDLWMRRGDRSYRVRGLARNLSYEVLKVNVLVFREGAEHLPGPGFHADVLDLYVSRSRQLFAKEAARVLGFELETLEKDLGKLLLALEAAQEAEIQRQLEPTEAQEVAIPEAERQEALAFLRHPDLFGEILADFERSGVVGEEENKLAGYLAAVSRKLERPLAIVVQSNSAAGKTALMEAVLAFMPEEEQVNYSAMTGQSLFYMEGIDLRHKILAIAEEEGAERASYSLKLLQSEGKLKIASTGKDQETGRHRTEDYEVEGPVMIFLTTTAIDVDEELMNRCLVLTVDEGREQTEAIHERQREAHTLEGRLQGRRRARVLRRHRNAQRLLRPLLVVNPYAPRLTFQGHRTRSRRDHSKYLTLIDAVALLHQHQREVKTVWDGEEEVEYIEVTLGDIRRANELSHRILGRSVDELPPQTRAFLRSLAELVKARQAAHELERGEVRFTRREVREATGLSAAQVHAHLARLEELEYVLVHTGRRGKSMVYELTHDGGTEEGAPFFPGLLDVAELEDTVSGEAPASEAEAPAAPPPPNPRSPPPPPKGDVSESGGDLSDHESNLSDPEALNSEPEAHLSDPIRGHFGPYSGPLRTPPEPLESLSRSSSSPSLEAENPASSQNARSGTPSAPRPVVAAARRRRRTPRKPANGARAE